MIIETFGSPTLAQQFVQIINEDLLKIKQPHFDIAWRLREAKDRDYASELGYKDIYELSESEFGFKKSSTAAYIAIANEFMRMSDMDVQTEYKSFSYSQLVEMLSLDYYDRRQIKPDMTVKQIRKYKQDHKFVNLENGDRVLYGELSDKQKQQYEDYRAKQKEESKLVQTSGQENVELDTENLQDFDKNITVASSASITKSSLLGFKNKVEREKFLTEYKSWGVWLSAPELELTCYKYKFANGAELVVSESYYYFGDCYKTDKKVMQVRYHLQDNEKCNFFDMSGIAKTYLLDYMTAKSKEI